MKETSTVVFKSNIQPVYGEYKEDRQFLSTIHDFMALEILRKGGFGLTPLQRKEFYDVSLHCAYAPKGDYPFGTIIDFDGKEKVVCRCINTRCTKFSNCRPDFKHSELFLHGENISFQQEVKKTEKSFSEPKFEHTDEGDSAAAALLYVSKKHEGVPQESQSSNEAEQKTSSREHKITKEENTRKQNEVIPALSKDNVSVPAASFLSFRDVSQELIIQSAVNDRIIVNAGPGTGKTWTLIEKIKYMLSEQDVEPENILVLCFSRDAVEVIKNRLELAAKNDVLPMNWHQLDVRTFDSLATYLISWLQENSPESLPKGYSLEYQSYDERIHTASQILKNDKELFSAYEHIIVDEVQDLVGVRAEMVMALLKGLPDHCGFTLLGDSCQALYDYLSINDESVISSEQFYNSIFHDFRKAKYYSLTHNYRQGDEFGNYTIPYRKAIISGDLNSTKQEIEKLEQVLTVSDINLKSVSAEEIKSLTKNGTLGILCRTNGQALQISSWLRANGLDHILQKPAQDHTLSEWIAKILLNAETDMIDYPEFSKLFLKFYQYAEDSEKSYWDALISTQKDKTKTHFKIEDLLRGLLQNARNPKLFEEPDSSRPQITVSNIHRAKGREFDSVLVLKDILENIKTEENDNLLEHKVCYVALTRPRKIVEQVPVKQQYIYISKDESRRCFKAGGYKNKKYLSHIEIIDSKDIDFRSFADTAEKQTVLQSLKCGCRLKLLKCPETATRNVVYKLVTEDDQSMVLGYTTITFAKNMERAIQRVFSNNNPIAYKYYPNIFGELYFDKLTTCVSFSGENLAGARKYGNMYIWYGMSISGFAQMEKDRY